MLSRQRWLILVVLAVMVLAACGSGDGGGSSAEPSSAQPSDGTPSAAPSGDVPSEEPEASGPEPSQGGGGGDFPVVADGVFTGGTMHVEVRGDRDETHDLTANAIASSGGVFINNEVGDDGVAVQVVWSNAEAAGAGAYTDKEIATAGEIPEQCELDVTENDGSGLAGVVECKDIEALVDGGTGIATIDLKIEFSLTR